MTITADWQIELPTRNLLIGDGTSFTIRRDPAAPKGFAGSPPRRAHDIERRIAHGSIAGRDSHAPRMMNVPVAVQGDGTSDAARQADAMTKLRPLVKGWAPLKTGELPMDVRFPGSPEQIIRYYGRPRDLAEDEWAWTFGRLHVSGLFVANDPVGYGASRSMLAQVATFTVLGSQLGEEDTRRVTLAITGNGGVPTVTNNTTGGSVVFNTVLAGAAVYTVDMLAQTVTLAGVNRDQDVTATSPWFSLAGGVDNSITLAGAASMDITWRAGYQ